MNTKSKGKLCSIFLIFILTLLHAKLKVDNMAAVQDINNLTITCWNSRGLVASLPYLHKLMETSDIIALSEHWLHANKLNVLTEISDDFNVTSRASSHSDASDFGYKRGQGGVALFWRKTLCGVTPITTIVHDRVCGIRLQCGTGRILNILSIYLPSPGSSEHLVSVLDDLSGIIDCMETGSLTLVCGDYNGDVGHLGGPRSTRRPTAQGTKIMKFLDEFSLVPCNLSADTKGPLNTFKGGVGASTIDYVSIPLSLCNDLVSCEVLVDPIINTSDHNAVQAILSVGGTKTTFTKANSPTRIKWNKVQKDVLFNLFTKPNEDYCDDLLQSTDFDNLNPSDLDQIISSVTTKLKQLGNNLPKTKFRKHIRPFWNETLNGLKKDKVLAYRV